MACATIDHVGSARELARLTTAHDAYRADMRRRAGHTHSLSDFRIEHGAVLDGLLTDSVAALVAVGTVKLKRAEQDGVRVRGVLQARRQAQRASESRLRTRSSAQIAN